MKYRKATLDNGLRVIMVEHHELPVVAIELLVKAGSVHEPMRSPDLHISLPSYSVKVHVQKDRWNI